MNEGYRIEEFYRASNSTQPVRIICPPANIGSPFGTPKQKDDEKTRSRIRQQAYQKSRSGTTYITSKLIHNAYPNVGSTKSKFCDIEPRKSSPPRPFSEVFARCETPGSPEEVKKDFLVPSVMPALELKRCSFSTFENGKSGESNPFLVVPNATVTSPEEEERLREKLSDSLSPSPFRCEDPSASDATLEELVVASASPTKNLIFSQFYGSEMSAVGSHKQLKKALKDHIIHTLESICLIKKLQPVPSQIVSKKTLPVEEQKRLSGKCEFS